MKSWVQCYQPYCNPDADRPLGSTVFRKVPFAVYTLDQTVFGNDTGENVVDFSEIVSEQDYSRLDVVRVSPGIVVTPICDIVNRKVDTLLVAELVSVEEYVRRAGLKSEQAKAVKKKVLDAQTSNPGILNANGVCLLPASEDHMFENHLVYFNSITSIRLSLNEDRSIDHSSICWSDNVWFHLSNQQLIDMISTEFARHYLRIGVSDSF